MIQSLEPQIRALLGTVSHFRFCDRGILSDVLVRERLGCVMLQTLLAQRHLIAANVIPRANVFHLLAANVILTASVIFR